MEDIPVATEMNLLFAYKYELIPPRGVHSRRETRVAVNESPQTNGET